MFKCENCPQGAICSGDSIPIVQDGYFPVNNNTTFVQCPVKQACIHSLNHLCSNEYKGFMCNECNDFHYRLGERCYW